MQLKIHLQKSNSRETSNLTLRSTRKKYLCTFSSSRSFLNSGVIVGAGMSNLHMVHQLLSDYPTYSETVEFKNSPRFALLCLDTTSLMEGEQEGKETPCLDANIKGIAIEGFLTIFVFPSKSSLWKGFRGETNPFTIPSLQFPPNNKYF